MARLRQLYATAAYRRSINPKWFDEADLSTDSELLTDDTFSSWDTDDMLSTDNEGDGMDIDTTEDPTTLNEAMQKCNSMIGNLVECCLSNITRQQEILRLIQTKEKNSRSTRREELLQEFQNLQQNLVTYIEDFSIELRVQLDFAQFSENENQIITPERAQNLRDLLENLETSFYRDATELGKLAAALRHRPDSPPSNSSQDTVAVIAKSSSRRLRSQKQRGEMFRCNGCSVSFLKKEHLDRHDATRHSNRETQGPQECEICEMSFEKPIKLAIHMRRHAGEDFY
ncbi:Similar to Zinc finger protein 436; acc. no. Q5R5Y7 [Pyronema omphalodes CBS 100304]|uniref:Similar to Zinc finger protein 436 acc. no. Q5R5Y7 n=1 Tax=Pyronema omphalodes (strain CBS 100304) TaxID=1076935 RepID=U4L211_PYROM|nr:Similar to Zinc finger protein 436; acc. no. Q5R5Y7 [Pyronema omphalodes CBS 100304]